MSVRSDLEAQFRTDWAEIPALSGWRVVATERAVDEPKVPTAVIRQKTIARLPEAPASHLVVGMALAMVAPYADPDQAADLLDDAVPAVLEYLRTRYRSVGEAEAVGWTGSRLAYDIALTVIVPNH